MKKRFLIAMFVVICMSLLVVAASAAAPIPQKPTLDVDFGTVTTIDGFTPPSQLYVNTTQRVLLVDEEGNYVTYPTYYVTKDNLTFDFDFSKLNAAQSIQYKKQSVVMVEIPNGVTTISNSYFAGTGNFPLCVSVQFPGSVTSYGANLFASYNSVIRVVEFLDGTEPITMGDGMFGSQHNGGTANLQYVKFPNNLVSIGKNTFGKSWQNKTIILGENLKTIGTGFFGEATPADKDTFIYISDNFFADGGMFKDLFGSFDQWHSNHMRLTFFYTGTKEQAQKLVDDYTAIQSGYVFSNSTLVSASEYVYETHKPTKNSSATIVYDFGKCDAFYNGVHNTVKQNACVEACTNCGLGVIEHADAKAENVTLTYANGLGNAGVRNTVCTNEGCGYKLTEQTEAIFQTEGYSIPEDGRGELVICYVVDKALLAEYEKLNSVAYTYGVFAIAANNIENNEIIDTDKVVMAEVERSYASFEMKLSGFDTVEKKNAELAFGAYIEDKNGNIVYIQPGILNENEKYSFITYDTIYNKAA